ncbi:M23 family metallopeptidase [Hydrogenophaga sp.]|uniref:M23 family metallopeptidase n=1 Tax=Hydrogenophaga sp. TaxID=1904254 RepID=UPI00261ED615|nr:M23 family metallopeptidase [Hydrogenophaga sp.]
MIRPLLLQLARFADATSQSLARHPRRIMGGLGVLLLGTGVTAFGIAPLAPDAADLPVRQVVEALDTPALIQSNLAPLTDVQPLVLFRTETTRRDDTAQSLLQRLGVVDPQAQAFLRSDPTARQLLSGRAGRLVSVETTDRQSLLRLTSRWLTSTEGNTFTRLVVEATPSGGYASRLEQGQLTASARLASGVIRSSLFAATDEANIPDSVAVQLAEMFSSNIDFRRDLRQGDRFSVVFESLEADGESLRTGRVLSAEFVNNGRTHAGVWFEEPGHKGGYYGFDGQSSRRYYLSSPLEFTRVSSGYGVRFHPISGERKAHLGVDYAAPTGTPVRTIGDGTVEFAGVQRGYGNVIYVRHRNNQTTVYAHLSRIGVRTGQRVSQGEFIGNVGSTGASTGPHLHLEFRDNGVHMDPLEIARQSEAIPLPAELRRRFDAIAQLQRMQLDAAATVQQASAE